MTDVVTAFRRAVAEGASLESEDARMAVARRHLAGVPMAEGVLWAVEVWAARGLPDWVVLRALGCDDPDDLDDDPMVAPVTSSPA